MNKNGIKINPSILIWARKKSHLDEKQISKYVGVTIERYRQFENGESKPTLRQLYLLAQKLNRPSQIFFLDNIPEEEDLIPKMRRLPGSFIGGESPELVKQINLALEYRELTINLLDNLNTKPKIININVDKNADSELSANKVREVLGIRIEDQVSWKDKYIALRNWRKAIENLGVLIFQMPLIQLDEMRGLSIFKIPLPIIGINSSDSVRARIFTIFHELVHILIGEMVLDSYQDTWFENNQNYLTEFYCNEVAADILVPNDDLLSQMSILDKKKDDTWDDYEIGNLADRYIVSRAVLIRKIRKVGFISVYSFNMLASQYNAFIPDKQTHKGGSHINNMISRMGTFLPELAFRNYYEEKLTSCDLSDLFNLQVKNLSKMEERVFSSSYNKDRE